MELTNNLKIAIAIGWLLLFDIILRTSSLTVSMADSIARIAGRGLFYGDFSFPEGILAIPAIVVVIFYGLKLYFSFKKIWNSIIEVSKIISQLIFGEQKNDSDQSDPLSEIQSIILILLKNVMEMWILLFLLSVLLGFFR